MKTLSLALKAAALVAVVTAVAGCESDYGYYHHRDGYYDRNYRNDRDRDRYRDQDRRWVCDSDGDDCHYERD